MRLCGLLIVNVNAGSGVVVADGVGGVAAGVVLTRGGREQAAKLIRRAVIANVDGMSRRAVVLKRKEVRGVNNCISILNSSYYFLERS